MDEPKNNRAIIRIAPDRLRVLLNLPEGYEVHHIFADNNPNTIGIVVQSEELEEQPWDVCLPTLEGSWKSISIVHRPEVAVGMLGEPQIYTRWGWERS